MTAATSLKHDVDLLSGIFSTVLAEQVGDQAVELLKRLRTKALERRAGVAGAGEALQALIHGLDEDDLAVAIKGLSISFDLANLAEDLQRVRVLEERDRTSSRNRQESIGDAIQRLHHAGRSAAEVQQLIDRLRIDLVFTAHPTEAKRRTTRRILRRLRDDVRVVAETQPGSRKEAAAEERMLSDLSLLWQVDPIRAQRPTVMNELERGLFFFDGLWEVIPKLRQDLRRALAECYPDQPFTIPPFVTFGSWIGGDRDGNPFVTHEVTAQALERLRRSALERHLRTCRELIELLVMSSRSVAIEPALTMALEHAVQRSTAVKAAVEGVAEVEVYRRWLKVIQTRLEATLAAAGGGLSEGIGYHHARDLAVDVRLLADSLGRHRGERIANALLQAWLDQIETFGLQFAALDVRQDSRTHVDVLAEIFLKTGLCADYAAADEPTRQRLLKSTPMLGNELLQYGLSDQARETLSLFKLLVRVVRSQGVERIGGHVISMTHYPSDLLAVLWFWRWAWKATPGDADKPLVHLPIVPLFETIDDLERGPAILAELLAIPEYRDYLRRSTEREPTQMVMVGYSDSTKDGGYLAACWNLFRVQDQLAQVTQHHGLRLMVFHGRGGALGRGGGPAARAILSLPPHSVGGALRMTEQGEVLAERYDDPHIAHRHLEQVTWATMLVSGAPQPPVEPAWVDRLQGMAEASYKHYRQLVEHAGFLSYFDLATPIGDIERLPIGSRPSRRRDQRSLTNLRAIPWTFAWTQSRHFLPAWYGLGTALMTERRSTDDWEPLQRLYITWPLFRAVIDNAVLALAKADMGIARRYAELTPADSPAREVWSLIEAEFQETQAAVLMITREPSLLADTPWLQRSIQERNPSVDPLNMIQIELIRRTRAAVDHGDEATVARLTELTRLTIQGVASGLRTTG
jgi:phosphoenolpyruvate carboxylase